MRTYSKTLHPINVVALLASLAFIGLHELQTQLFYDGLAQDVSIFSSQGSVVLLLVVVLLMENRRRGMFFTTPMPMKAQVIDFARKYHGYLFSWAAIYTFWYHPMLNTSGHLIGFFYMFLILIQGSLFLTRAHTNRVWTLCLELLVAVLSLLIWGGLAIARAVRRRPDPADEADPANPPNPANPADDESPSRPDPACLRPPETPTPRTGSPNQLRGGYITRGVGVGCDIGWFARYIPRELFDPNHQGESCMSSSGAPLTPLTLAALALLAERPMHPYEMYQLSMQRRDHRLVKIRPGTLYHAVRRLAESGLVAVVGTEREGNRPERTTYEITDAGRDQLESSVALMLAQVGR